MLGTRFEYANLCTKIFLPDDPILTLSKDAYQFEASNLQIFFNHF